MKLLSIALLIISLSASLKVVHSQYPVPYSTTDVMEFLYASAAAYCTEQSWLTQMTCGSICNNLTGYEFFYSYNYTIDNDQTVQFIMIYNPSSKRFVTAFQGTKGITQLIEEILQSMPVNYTMHNIPNAQLEEYFGNYYTQYLRTNFLIQIQAAINQFSDYQFVFTGHSLGGALTTIAGVDAILSGFVSASNTLMYTYGSPRVGNYYLAQAADPLFGGVYRVVHYQDIVPHIPPCNLGDENCSLSNPLVIGPITWSPWHIGTEIWYTETFSSYQTCTTNLGEDPLCSDSVPLLECSITDHTHYFNIEVGQTCDDDNNDNEEGEEEGSSIVQENIDNEIYRIFQLY